MTHRVCVLGGRSFVGQNILRGTLWSSTNSDTLDLTDQLAVESFFRSNKYDVVIHCGVVGGSRLRPDDPEVFYKNVLMFENVVRFLGKSFQKLIYFSSGAALQGDPPTDPYGFSKWVIDKRIQTLPGAYSLRIWGCWGPGELPTRFSAVCREHRHVTIHRDRYFDFIDVHDVRKIVHDYVEGFIQEKDYNLVYPGEKKLLSEWATGWGATYVIEDPSCLDPPYISPEKL
jgi:nucleoside-diphosphate-sugar epimerase